MSDDIAGGTVTLACGEARSAALRQAALRRARLAERRDGYHIAVRMSSILPGTRVFDTPVYGTVFGDRKNVLHRLHEGDELILVPDPPGTEEPSVWVHAPGGDVVGHLSPDINSWLVPWMLEGGRCRGFVTHVGDDTVASYKRLIITVRCRA